MSAQPIIDVASVTRTFPTASGTFTALQDVSLSIADGQFVAIVGPSGCGKSTLLQLVAGLDGPTAGQVRLDGELIAGPRPDKIGIVFQDSLLLPWQSARDNVAFPLKLCGVPAAERHAKAERLLKLVGLSAFADRIPSQLSGGMRQRVSIARALVREPRLLLMDEPFGALDEQTRTRMWLELQRIHQESRTSVLFITHSLIEAAYLADVVLVMAPRPGRFIDVIDVTLPRPRTPELLGSEELGRIRNRIWNKLVEADGGGHEP